MRQHLLNAVIVNREFGQSEEEAATDVLGQFGPPQETTRGLIQAWRREQKLRRRDFWGAIVCVLLATPAMSWVYAPLDAAYWNWAIQHHHWDPMAPHNPWFPWFWGFFAFEMAFYGLAVGLVSGMVFPRRAVAGAGLAALVLTTIAVTRWVVGVLQIPDGVPRDGLGLADLVAYVAVLAIFSTATVCGARGGIRWCTRHARLIRA